ncbi:type IV pilus modification PilV family protein [Haloimpatiens massiliensis]|uniref:type IV pilus modification PilV family protein n=1 Tax=Haloimpatiens massiliensis TaxID=1658110 RepID=UPI000C81FE9E|nr:prepilin-type N-terminal cleavage/methylation domain-containing protein [Haloimpatiens massiliensis]
MRLVYKRKSGLTLIEVLISLAILGIIITPFLSMGLSTVSLGEKSEEKQQALAIAQEYMEKIKSPEFKISELDAKEITDGISHKIERNGKKYLVKYKIKPLKEEEKIEKVNFQYLLEIGDSVEVYKIYRENEEEKRIALGDIGSLSNETEKLVINKESNKITFNINTNDGKEHEVKVEDNINNLQSLSIRLHNINGNKINGNKIDGNKINLDTKNYEGELNLYMDLQEFYNINSSLGKINYVFNYRENSEDIYGDLFKINITVSKKNFKGNEDILQILQGYKRY